MFERFFDWIKHLFGKRPALPDVDRRNADFAMSYADIRRVNFGAIFAHRLANKAVADSAVTVDTSTARGEWVDGAVQAVWSKIKIITEQALGTGGKIVVPRIKNGRPRFDIVDQSRMMISEMDGDEPVSVTLMADFARVNDRNYIRFVDYTLASDGTHTITNRVTTDAGGTASLTDVPQWADISEEIVIHNCEHLLLGYLKSPIDNREDKGLYGVPVTYGSEPIVSDLYDCMDDFAREFRLKRSFVGADEMLFGKDSKLPADGLFKTFQGGGALDSEAFWQVYDPAIRDSSYKNRYDMLCAQLEQSVGTSRGILTEPTATAAATATEIKAAQYDTFCLVDDIRTAIEGFMNQLAYAYDVLAEAFGATPAGARGSFELTFDWDLSAQESTSETFGQLSELESRNLITGARLVSWVTGDSIDDAQAEIDEARAQSPKVQQLIGGDGIEEGQNQEGDQLGQG